MLMEKGCRLSDMLEIASGSVIAVVGCGGKTSLIELLARQNADKRVLITPTTKMFPISAPDVMMRNTVYSSLRHMPKSGISLLGQINKQSGKLEALPESALYSLIPKYDIVFIEADGSRGLPCKGWVGDEPIIPICATHTVGVVTMDALGRAAANDIVHNLSAFLELTGLNEGDVITGQALENMVCLQEGMYRNSFGKRYLVVNKVQDEASVFCAVSILRALKKRYPERFRRLVYGSVHDNIWHWM